MLNLIISGHPQLQTGSLSNRIIVQELQAKLPDAEIIDINTLYPQGQIVVAREQERLQLAKHIVLQFPLYWYALPYPLKNYLDRVFTHGFAHGGGAKLGGRALIFSFTTGAPETEYASGRSMNHDISAFMLPWQQTCALCQLRFYEVHSCGMMFIPGVSTDADKLAVENKARAHAQRLIKLLGEI